MLKRMCDSKSEIESRVNKKRKPYKECIRGFAFCIDISQHMKEHNLQGMNHLIK